MKKNFALTLVLLCISSIIWAQGKTINGTITDSKGIPLPGASVIETGTTNGTQTDFNGLFTIAVKDGASIMVSYIGMGTQTIVVGNKKTLKISLQEDTSQLNEIVIVGYGSQKKVNLTGSVVSVDIKKIARQPVTQTSQALTGLVSGLTAVQTSGQPGGDGATIRIRGIGTLGSSAKNNPLILVDGIPDDIDGIDSGDIKSISVLKDASASAIYGSRAANGVILITTNRGKEGAMKTSYSSYIGVQGQTQNLDFLNSLEYMEAFNDAQPGTFPNAILDKYRAGVGVGTEALPDTDWVKELFSEPGFQQYHNISMKGGGEKARVAATLSYLSQEGNIANFDFNRVSGRINTDLKLSKKFDVSFDLNFRREKQKQPALLFNITREAYRLQPLFNAYNDDGSWGEGFGGSNPVARVNSGSKDEQITNYFRGVVKATYRPIENMAIAVTYAPQFIDKDGDNFNRPWSWKTSSSAEPRTIGLSSLTKSTTTSFTDNFNAIVNYSKEFGNHSWSGLVGYEFQKFKTETWGASRGGFVLPEYTTLNNGDASTQLNNGTATLNGLESVFGRINYAYKGKYLFEANVRRDASSRFGKDFRSATFPSFSAGWRISEEAFFPKNTFVSDLKLRTSWGQLGNQFIFDDNGNPVNFAYASLFGLGNANSVLGNAPVIGGAQSVLANSILKWETGETMNLAVDASLFKNRLKLTAEYYVRTTKDILLGVTIPTSTGFNAPTQNAGEVQNKGLDFDISWQDNIGQNFTYGITANYAVFKNKITDLGGLKQLPPGDYINRVGESVGSIFGLKVEGLYQETDFTNGVLNAELPIPAFGAIKPGDIKYVDYNDDKVINNDDRTIIGSSIDTKNWGFDFFAEYKGFDIAVSVQGVSGRDVYLQGDAGWSFFNAGKIQRWQTDYWTPENTDASLPRLTALSAHHNWRVNETWTHNASYVRIRNFTLGYKLPKSLLNSLKISNFRIYVSGQNLFTFDNMPDGIDPLIPNFNEGTFYPVAKVYTLGLNVSF